LKILFSSLLKYTSCPLYRCVARVTLGVGQLALADRELKTVRPKKRHTTK